MKRIRMVLIAALVLVAQSMAFAGANPAREVTSPQSIGRNFSSTGVGGRPSTQPSTQPIRRVSDLIAQVPTRYVDMHPSSVTARDQDLRRKAMTAMFSGERVELCADVIDVDVLGPEEYPGGAVKLLLRGAQFGEYETKDHRTLERVIMTRITAFFRLSDAPTTIDFDGEIIFSGTIRSIGLTQDGERGSLSFGNSVDVDTLILIVSNAKIVRAIPAQKK